MKFKQKPVIVEAITFAEFVQYGIDSGAGLVRGMPWSFRYNGHPVTHENDECYIISTPGRSFYFTPEDVLVTREQGTLHTCRLDTFAATYEPA